MVELKEEEEVMVHPPQQEVVEHLKLVEVEHPMAVECLKVEVEHPMVAGEHHPQAVLLEGVHHLGHPQVLVHPQELVHPQVQVQVHRLVLVPLLQQAHRQGQVRPQEQVRPLVWLQQVLQQVLRLPLR